ncbi:unnamed protein product [Symbiodinium sp. KB8]|nr:unnamed protein product [Symbiodinium sp. KB8]
MLSGKAVFRQGGRLVAPSSVEDVLELGGFEDAALNTEFTRNVSFQPHNGQPVYVSSNAQYVLCSTAGEDDKVWLVISLDDFQHEKSGSWEGAGSEYDLLFGDGPVVCKLQLGVVSDGAGNSSPHFRCKRKRDQMDPGSASQEADMTAIAKYEVLSAFADGRAHELAEILEAARLPGHAYFTDGWHLSDQGMRAACDAQLADLAEGFDLIVSDSTLCVVEKEEAKQVKGGDGGRLVNSLVPAPVHPAWGKGFYRGGFCRHLWKILENKPGEDRASRLLLTLAFWSYATVGNDCLNEWCSPEELRHEMQHMRQAYEEEGVQIHVLDVVMTGFPASSQPLSDEPLPHTHINAEAFEALGFGQRERPRGRDLYHHMQRGRHWLDRPSEVEPLLQRAGQRAAEVEAETLQALSSKSYRLGWF